MMKKISFVVWAFSLLVCVGGTERPAITEQDLEDDCLWNSKPEEVGSANIQILDKVSGKVFRKKINVNQEIQFESLKIILKRCFRNSPDDPNEVYAYVVVQDGERVRFSGWLFASAPAVNLFEHSVYDVRVEF